MNWIRARGLGLALLMSVMLGMSRLGTAGVSSAVTTTTISDTVYHADGTTATGTLLVSWTAFTTAAGQAIAGGSTSAAIANDGTFSVTLAPNAGAMPSGTFYTVTYHLDDGSVSRETWSVPASSATVGALGCAEHGGAELRGGAGGDEGICQYSSGGGAGGAANHG